MFVSPDPDSFSERLAGEKTNAEFLNILYELTDISPGQASKRKLPDKMSETSRKKIPMPNIDTSNVDGCSSEIHSRLPVDTDTEKCYIGRYEVSVLTLSPPPDELRCRDLNLAWVKQIKEGLKSATAGTCFTLPCLIDPKELSHRDDFKPERLDLYKKFTLGGNHVRSALQEYLQENDDRHMDSLRRVNVDLYAGLTNCQARRVGNLHNIQTTTSKPTMMDAVRLCRRILYEMSETDMTVNEPPAPSAEWKRRCQIELAQESKTLNSLSTIFHLALYSKRCWEELDKIAQSEVKNAHDGRCNLKQPAFQKLQGLADSYRFQLLARVASGQATLNDVGKEADISKKMDLIKGTFNKLTNCSSWDQARDKYPYFTDDNRLKERFLTTRFDRRHVPQDFARWCAEAVENPNTEDSSLFIDDVDVDITVSFRGQLIPGQSVSNICDKYKGKIKQEVAKLKNMLHAELEEGII